MLRILGIRTYVDQKTGKLKKAEKFAEKSWEVETANKLLVNYEDYLEKIPEKEHYNLFVTIAHSDSSSRKKFEKQNIIVFDIDDVDTSLVESYYAPICEAIGVDWNDIGWINTGNGFHIIIDLDYSIEGKEFYEAHRPYYKEICRNIDKALRTARLPGYADPDMFKYTNMFRLPGTRNIKNEETGYKNKNSIKNVTCDHRVMKPLAYYLHDNAGIEVVPKADQVDPDELSKYPTPDTNAVLTECDFIAWCKANPDKLSQEQWYKLASILPRLKEGYKLFHDYSQGHPDYTPDETDSIMERARNSAGPRTCRSIEESFSSCRGCKHYGKKKSPIMIQGSEYLATKDTGFRVISEDKNGLPKAGKISYEDLTKFFYKKNPFICTESEIFYIWQKTHWEEMKDLRIKEFANKTVFPKPSNAEANEFLARLTMEHVVDDKFFEKTTYKKVNLLNGVLDLDKDSPTLVPHSKKHGFMSVLPYEYDPKAACPTFDRFMDDISCSRPELVKIILEFAGYSFTNMECTLAKSMILVGEGKNGKSTFIDVLKSLAGENTYSNIPLSKLTNDQYIANLRGKLFNITEETPMRAFEDSSTFKDLVSGGEVMAKVVYKAPMKFRNRAKFITSCNEMPPTSDLTYGMLRRLLIVPFDAVFEGGSEDINIKFKLGRELPGILNRVIAASLELVKTERFSESKATDTAKTAYVEDNDHVRQFRKECINLVDEAKTEFVYVFKAYLQYCEDVNLPKHLWLSKNMFARRFGQVFPDYKNRKKRLGVYNTVYVMGIVLGADKQDDIREYQF